MSYEFLKNEVKKQARLDKSDKDFVSYIDPSENDAFILENNVDIYCDMLDFLETEDRVFILNGFMGSGKSVLLNLIPKGLKEDVLVFKINCSDSVNLDDIFLSLFQDFAFYSNNKKVLLPKVNTLVFTEKINAFIKACNHPMVFILDSFDVLNLNQRVQKDILDFIGYLSNYEKIKVVVGSRSFDEDDMPSSEGVRGAVVKLLDSNKFNELLKANNINENAFIVEQMFKNTKGHYIYVSLFLNLLGLLNISFDGVMNEFSKRNSTFSEFLLHKVLSLIPDKFLKVLWFLACVRHELSKKAILNLKLASIEDLKYLQSRMILNVESGMIILKDYYKNELIKAMEPETQSKIHSYLVDIYNSQLPKKPTERDLVISRATMRQEIEYHKRKMAEFLKSTKQPSVSNASGDNLPFNYLSYAKTVGYEWSFGDTTISSSDDSSTKKIDDFIDKSQFNKNAFSKKNVDLPSSAVMPETTYEENTSLEGLIKKAQEAEEKFNYKLAIDIYNSALEKQEDISFESKQPLLIEKMASCYKKVQDFETAIGKFNQAYELYVNTNPVRAKEILINIAQIYTETYKFERAKEIYAKLLQSDSSPKLLARIYLDMADIEDNCSNIYGAIKFCEKALPEAEKTNDAKTLSEVYFKYGLYCDDVRQVDVAFKYYLKCSQVSKDSSVNSYLSSAYSNLASIYTEKKDIKNAIEYYKLAVSVDEKQNNYEGLYFGYSKLAGLLKSFDPDNTLDNLLKALGAAKRLSDKFYVASAYLDLGDFYYNKKTNEKALKAYVLAKKILIQHPSKENIQKVNERISDLKVRLGNAEFGRLIGEFEQSEN